MKILFHADLTDDPVTIAFMLRRLDPDGRPSLPPHFDPATLDGLDDRPDKFLDMAAAVVPTELPPAAAPLSDDRPAGTSPPPPTAAPPECIPPAVPRPPAVPFWCQ